MCTLTWLREPDGYQAFFNRDELRTRGIAVPPEERCREGVAYLAPTDSDAGGTWIGVNELGLGLCLLNHYGESAGGPPAGAPRSRGLLVAEMMDAGSLSEVAHRARATDLCAHLPFRLVALQPGEAALELFWNGADLDLRRLDDEDVPVTSSSRDPDGAFHQRRAHYERARSGVEFVDARFLEDFHRSHGSDGASATSTCMHREDAVTVSRTRIAVTPRAVQIDYLPGSPCERATSVRRELPRRGATRRLELASAR